MTALHGPLAMGPKFTCPNCRHAHRFLAAQAGQTIHCHGCGFVFRVPPMALAEAPADGSLAVTPRWLLRLPGGRQFGPVRREIIVEWLREGRADADCFVSPVPGRGWYRLPEAFQLPDRHSEAAPPSPPLPAAGAAATPSSGPSPGGHDLRDAAPPAIRGSGKNAAAPRSASAILLPASGLLDLLDEDYAPEAAASRGGRRLHRQHAAALKSLEAESQHAGGFPRFRGARLVKFPASHHSPRRTGSARESGDPLHIDAATVTAWQGPQGGEFYCVIPWSARLGRLPHEFLSILPGRLPGPVALRRAHEEGFDGGCWIGITGDSRDIAAHAAGLSAEPLDTGIQWTWRSRTRLYQMIQVWGIQAIPLGAEKFAHLTQTSQRRERKARTGLLWYLERQTAFWRFARRLNLPGEPGSPVLFASCGARLLTMAAGNAGQSTVA